MAKPGDPAKNAEELAGLKMELLRAVKEISERDECGIGELDRASEALRALKDLKLNNTHSFKLEEEQPPEAFRCPLSHKLMTDPVFLANGQTYDRHSIERWFKSGSRICPLTQQVLSHTNLTPNHLIREMIAEWCKRHGIELLDLTHLGTEDGGIKVADREHFLNLITKMTSAQLTDKKEAAKEFRSLTKRMQSFREHFGDCPDTISQLLTPLAETNPRNQVHHDLQEDLVTTILNISICDRNKKLVAETPKAIPLLIDALKYGNIQTRANAAAALFTLSAIDSNKVLIGNSGALKPLIELLEEGHPQAMKDVASAIFNLCIVPKNKETATKDGAVQVVFTKIMKRVHVDEMLAILAILSTDYYALEELFLLDSVPVLFSVIRDSTCPRNKENCIAILHALFCHERSLRKEFREEERTHGTISQLSESGTLRAKRKANAILGRLNRVVVNTARTA